MDKTRQKILDILKSAFNVESFVDFFLSQKTNEEILELYKLLHQHELKYITEAFKVQETSKPVPEPEFHNPANICHKRASRYGLRILTTEEFNSIHQKQLDHGIDFLWKFDSNGDPHQGLCGSNRNYTYMTHLSPEDFSEFISNEKR